MNTEATSKKQKVLFIDRDGTIIQEPPGYQVDAFEKVTFYPKVFTYLSKIAKELDYKLVMITNQDGLGTDSFPEDTFWPVHNFILKAFENEGVVFDRVFIDKTLPEENANTRKPGTGMLTEFFSEEYDLENSFVLGDRITDIELAKNLGAQGIFISDHKDLGADEITTKREDLDAYIALETTDWQQIYEFLKLKARTASISRKTNETDIEIELNLDGTGKSDITCFKRFYAITNKTGAISFEYHKYLIFRMKMPMRVKNGFVQ